jgi:hypothetical protein
MKKKNFLIFFEKNLPQGRKGGSLIIFLSLALLFIISVTYFYLYNNDLFFYQENKSLFIFSSEYFQKFAVKPGGLLEYAANFLTQWYYNSFYGSLIVSSLFVLLSFVFIEITKRLSTIRSFSSVFIVLPSCLLMLLQKSYDHLMYNNLGYLLVALWFLISILIENKRLSLSVLALFPVLFYIVGSFAFIYLGMYTIYCFFHKKGIQRFSHPAAMIATAFLMFILFKEVLFLQPVNHLLCYPLPIISFSGLPVLLYLICGYIILFPCIVKAIASIKLNKSLSAVFVMIMITILIIYSLTVSLLSRSDDPVRASIINLERSVYRQDWDSIIKKHESVPFTDIVGQYYYNLALSEKGQLCDRLFYSRQDFGAGALTLPHNKDLIDKCIYFYYAIGLISEAHHLAVESMVINGYCPENIKLLIKTELINGNYRIAERFINVLKRTIHYRKWSEKYEKMIYDTALINSDPELGEKSRMLPKKDFFIRPNDMQNIELILISNPNNKKAFEYKMAVLLFEKDLDAIVSEAKIMKEMGYIHFPRYIEEAIVEAKQTKNVAPEPSGLIPESGTELQFKQYRTAYDLNNKLSPSLLEEKMKNSWGNTYWFYHEFR